jgi:FkbM family methyltransferase
MTGLIYDIGMDNGDDSEFYLLKGFRVVAVEADPDLCRAAEQRFQTFLRSGQLTIVNRAIVPTAGPVTFYRSSNYGWGTVVEDWHRYNVAHDVAADSLVVDGTTLADLVDTYGPPFYLKVDIEGMDRAAIESLTETRIRPPYVSMEISFDRSPTLASIRSDFDALVRLGYDRFKLVDQVAVPRQSPPSPPLMGRYVPHTFSSSASGLFGEEVPGEWLSAEAALQAFQRICRKNWLALLFYRRTGLYRYYVSIAARLTGHSPNLGWYDIHAKHSSVE